MTTTLITGASGGIGEAFARRLAAEKHDLFLVARSGDKLRALCDELKNKHNIDANFAAVDLIEPDSHLKVFEATRATGLRADWLINNAGFGSMGDFVDLDMKRELDMIELNIRALVGLTHLFLKPMRERKTGKVINISSGAGFQPIPFMATYAATKSFVTSFSEAIAEENRPFGIQVLAVCPGSTDTGFFEAAKMDRALSVKGQETPEQVVETTMQAVRSNRSKVVSGWTNWAVASATNFVPNSLIAKAMAKALRGRFQQKPDR